MSKKTNAKKKIITKPLTVRTLEEGHMLNPDIRTPKITEDMISNISLVGNDEYALDAVFETYKVRDGETWLTADQVKALNMQNEFIETPNKNIRIMDLNGREIIDELVRERVINANKLLTIKEIKETVLETDDPQTFLNKVGQIEDPEENEISDVISILYSRIIDYSRSHEHTKNIGLVLLPDRYKEQMAELLYKNMPEKTFVKVKIMSKEEFLEHSSSFTFSWALVGYKKVKPELTQTVRSRIRI